MLELYASNVNSYEFMTGKSLAMFLFKDNNKIFLLRGTTVSPYMSEKMHEDVQEALNLGFSLFEIADLYDDRKSVSLYCTNIETFEKFSNDNWNWHKWSMTSHFYSRFWECISNGVKIRNI